MKKIAMFLIAATSMLQLSNAQIAKGSLLLTGNASYSGYSSSQVESDNTWSNKTSSLSVTPGLGYFAANNFVVGAGIGYYSQTSSYDNKWITGNNEDKDNTLDNGLQLSPYAAYYCRITDKVYISITAAFAYKWSLKYDDKSENTSGTSYTETDVNNVDNHTINVSLVPAFVFFLNNRLTLQASIGRLYYNEAYMKNNDLPSNNYNSTYTSGLNLDMTAVTFGIQYFLIKK